MRNIVPSLAQSAIVSVGLFVNLPQPALAQALRSDAVGSTKTYVPAGRTRPTDRAAIAEVGRAFAQAFKANDVKAVSALYADDGEIVDEQGERIRGRTAIEQAYAGLFERRPGASIKISPGSLQFLGPDFAREEGRTTVLPHEGGDVSSRQYEVLYSRVGTKWLYFSVQEDFDKRLSNHERLKELEWMTGEWIDENSDSLIHSTCDWSTDKNFLLREFTVHMHGKSIMTVSQRIGWDPVTRQIKSWVFDSEGGYGEAYWNQDGHSWLIKSTGVGKDGQSATATHLLTRLNATSARWTPLNRTVGGRVVTTGQESVLVKKPPRPSSK